MDPKSEAHAVATELPMSNAARATSEHIVGHTKNDELDMLRMGKKQQLKRTFHQFSIIALTSLAMSSWLILFIANTQGLNDGGLAGLFWSYLWTLLGMGAIIASLAEMASMAPTIGGQYHWVSEFSPPRYQRFLSYITGWMSTLSWQASNASGPFLLGAIIQGIAIANHPEYDARPWQGTLIMFAIVLILYINNTYYMSWLPMINSILIYVYVGVFAVLVGILLGYGPLNSPAQVFTEFTNEGGWSSTGLSLMVGQITAIFALICSDAAVHMGEETSEASISVPRAMWWSYVANGIMGLVFLIAMLFAIPSVDDAVNDKSGFPFIYMLQQKFPGNIAAVNALVALILVLSTATSLGFNAVTSRQTFAFARDRGLPFSDWIGHIDKRLMLPVNAIVVTCAIACLLALINIGSNTAFNAIISLNLVALLFTYIVSIGCLIHRRVTKPHSLPRARWTLGRVGLATNCIAVSYGVFAFFWSFWPNKYEPGLEDFNWATVIFLGVFLMALVTYYMSGRRNYKGPVTLVRQDEFGLDMYESDAWPMRANP